MAAAGADEVLSNLHGAARPCVAASTTRLLLFLFCWSPDLAAGVFVTGVRLRMLL